MSLVTEFVKITYRVQFESSFHFGTGLRNGLIHRAVARNKEGYLYIPGSTLKGVVRERCEQLAKNFSLTTVEPHSEDNALLEANIADPDIIMRIFGSRFIPGALYFDDAQMLKEDRQGYFDGEGRDGKKRYQARQVETRTQVSLSRKTRTAKQGHLFTSEYGIKILNFEGKIYGHLAGFQLEELGTYSLLLLLASFLSVDRIGGNKSTGAGQIRSKIQKLIINEQDTPFQDILEQLPYLEYYQLEREENQ